MRFLDFAYIIKYISFTKFENSDPTPISNGFSTGVTTYVQDLRGTIQFTFGKSTT